MKGGCVIWTAGSTMFWGSFDDWRHQPRESKAFVGWGSHSARQRGNGWEVSEALGLRSLHNAFFVGDVLAKQDVSRLRQLAPNVTVVNMYGTTETQRSVSYLKLPPDGAPIPDCTNPALTRQAYPLLSPGLPSVVGRPPLGSSGSA